MPSSKDDHPNENNGGGSSSSGSNNGLFDKFWNSKFWNNEHIDINQQIHDELNSQEERRKQRQRFFDNFGGFGDRNDDNTFWGGRRNNNRGNDATSSSSSHHQHQHPFDFDGNNDIDKVFEKFHQEMFQDFFNNTPNGSQSRFEQRSSSSSNKPGSSVFSRQSYVSSYQMKQDSTGATEINIQLPSRDGDDVKASDINVQVLQTKPTCVIQWETTNTKKNGDGGDSEQQQKPPPPPVLSPFPFRFPSNHQQQRLQLGSNADCEKLSANLSKGILKLKVPPKDPETRTKPEQPRIIPITTTTTTTTPSEDEN